MKQVFKIAIAIVVVLVGLLGVGAQFIPAKARDVAVTSYTSNSGELAQDILVGQTFVANQDDLSAVSVMFATYSNRKNTQDINFHLRSSTDSPVDIRSGIVSAKDLRDNQFYQFSFDPIPDSRGKSYFFFVVSPASVSGDAVAVDLDIYDPYHFGSAYLVRGQGSAITSPAILAVSGKPTADVVFETYYTTSLRVVMVDNVIARFRAFIASWDENQSLYIRYAQLATPGVLLIVLAFSLSRDGFKRIQDRPGVFWVLVALLIFGIGFRVFYATSLPVTNDEGNYLYDARSIRQGIFAGGDGYVKAPLVIVWMAFWQMIVGDTILAGRMASIVANSFLLLPIYFLARDLWGKRFGLMSAGLWALVPVSIVFGIYAHTQALALLFGVGGIAVTLMALRGTTPRLTFITSKKIPSALGWFVFAGVLLGLGVASRKSVLALGLVPLMLVLLESDSWKARGKHLLAIGGGFLAVLVLFLTFGYAVYGPMGVAEAIGFNSAEDGISQVDPTEVDQAREYSLRGMTPFFRESLPIILLSLLGFGFAGERVLSLYSKKYLTQSSAWGAWFTKRLLPLLGFLPAFLVFFWAWGFFNEYEGSLFMFWGIPTLWYLFLLIMTLVLFIPKDWNSYLAKKNTKVEPVVVKSTQPLGSVVGSEDLSVSQAFRKKERAFRESLSGWFITLLWVGGLWFFYVNWIKFHANYISEFIPPLVLISGYGFLKLLERFKGRLFFGEDYPFVDLLRRLVVVGMVGVIFWAFFVTGYITYVYEHTGTFDQRSAVEAGQWAKDNIPQSESIFTGAGLVPYLSGHHTALDIAHPRWYAYEFTRKDTARLNTFLPPAETMVQAFRDTQWFLLDRQTGFSFLMEYSEIERSLEEDFVSVHSVENGSNTLTFYRRIR